MEDHVYSDNVVLLTDIATKELTDPVVIEAVFYAILKNMKELNSHEVLKFISFFERYFEFLGKSMIDSFFREEEVIKYRKNIWQCFKNELMQKKYLYVLKKEFLESQKSEDYSMLPYLYTLLYMIENAMAVHEYYFIEQGNILLYASSDIMYFPKEEIKNPFYYDEMIRESMLELQKK